MGFLSFDILVMFQAAICLVLSSQSFQLEIIPKSYRKFVGY